MRLARLAMTLGALALASASSHAAPPIAPSVAQPVATRLFEGFRSAHFRMTPDEVRRAIAIDFPGVPIVERNQPAEGTTVFQLTVDQLDPGPGAAAVSYVFGATSRTLAQVAVVWATKAAATPGERRAIAVAALRLSNYFRAAAQPRMVLAPKILSPGAVSVYGALDASGAGIELVASGVAYGSPTAAIAAPTGPASLRLSYMANPANPDVKPRSSPMR